ncbi:MAG: alpha/beta hydrolase-fold protein [Verrucomicrobiota bacterium]
MKPMTSIRIVLILGCLTQAVLINTAQGQVQKPPVRLPTDPGTPALIPAGPDAENLARAALDRTPSTNDAANNPTQATPGANPPVDVDGNFLISPPYVPAPELSVVDGVPQGRVQQFSMSSTNSRFYPGIARTGQARLDPDNPKTLIVQTHPAPYTRTVTVYVPSQYVPGTAAPFIVSHDGPPMGHPDLTLARIFDNLIAERRIPVMVTIMIGNGGSDAQGSERGLEYDTMSGKFAEYIEREVLPLVEKTCQVKLTKDPDGRAVMGGSSGGAAALEMAWYHPNWYHRVISYSGTFVNQQWPFNPGTPDGAWDFHEKLIPNNARKPIRIWLEVGDDDNFNPNLIRDNMHDWVAANNRMATVLRAKGYHYQYVFAQNAGHVDRAVRNQTLPEALEWVWQGYGVK